MKNKTLLSYVVCLIILGILFLWLDKSSLKLLLDVDLLSISVSLLLGVLIYFTSGLELYFIRKQFGVSLSFKDILLLPIVGNLWSFIFPFQGNLLFTTLFFKQKYNMKISDSFSISIYLYLITLSFTGLFGLLFAVYYNMLFSWLGLLSLIFLLNPLFVFISGKLLKIISQAQIGILNRLQFFISSIVDNTGMLWKDINFTMIILAISLVRIFLSIIWYYWICYSLGFNLSFLAVALMSLIMSVSIIIKITPDNLGVAQLITGSFMGSIGISSEQAVMITLFASATTMILIFTVGLYGNYYYFKTVNFGFLMREM